MKAIAFFFGQQGGALWNCWDDTQIKPLTPKKWVDLAQKKRMKREKMSSLKKENRKSIHDYCLTSDMVDRLERLKGIYLSSVIRVRVTVEGWASLVAVSFEHATCWMKVCRSC